MRDCRDRDTSQLAYPVVPYRNTFQIQRTPGRPTVGTYNTSDFRKGLKVQIDGVPYLMVEMNFRKPGKGNALYECKLKNLVRGTDGRPHLPRGQTLEEADVVEFAAQFLYRQQDMFVFMNNEIVRAVRAHARSRSATPGNS